MKLSFAALMGGKDLQPPPFSSEALNSLQEQGGLTEAHHLGLAGIGTCLQ